MKKLLAIILFSTAATDNCFPWKAACYRTLQATCWYKIMHPTIERVLAPWSLLRHYPALTDRLIVTFIDEQLRKHQLNPASINLLLEQEGYSPNAFVSGTHILGINRSLAAQIYSGLQASSDPATNPLLGSSALDLAHEIGHIKHHHSLVRTTLSALSIPAIWFLTTKLLEKYDKQIQQRIDSIENKTIKTGLSSLKKGATFALPFLIAWYGNKIFANLLWQATEYQADTYALSHAPSPLAASAWASGHLENARSRATGNIFTRSHPTALSRANRALDYAQNMLKAQAAAAA